MNNEIYLRRDFDKNIEEKFGPEGTVKYFDYMNMEETPTFEMYGNNGGVKGTPDKQPEELETTLDLSTDVYLNASIVLSLGERMARGGIVSWKQDVNDNLIGRKNANPIPNSRWYKVEFDDGEGSELTFNVIVEQMNSHSDENGNDLLLLDYFIDYRNSEREMYL